MLLVDDEPQVLVALEDLLSDEFMVLTSPSPEKALEIAETEADIAVIISDERMPRLRGSELFARIRDASDARRILVTGFADLAAVVRAVNDGKIFAYVTKPWDGSDLKQKVHEAADQYRLVKEVTSEHQLLRDLMDNTPDGICFKDRQLRIRGANRSFASLLGVPSDSELVGKLVEEVNPAASHLAESRAQELTILQTGHPLVDDLKEVIHGARHRWVSESIAPVRGMDGEIAGLVGITRDVTERVLMNQTLQESEARLVQQTRLLNATLNSMREAVIASDRSGQFVLFNRQAQAMFGPPPSGASAVEWAQSQLVSSVAGQAQPDAADNPLVRAIRGERVDEAEISLGNASAGPAVFAVTGAELMDERAQPVGGLALIRDVTSHRSLERQLAQAQKMEAIGRLAGGMAHDFNNVLSVIVSYANFVKQGLDETSSAYEDINQVLSAVDRAARLTRQLLTISRNRPATQRPLQLNEIVESLEKMLSRVIGEDITVVTSLAPSLALVKADPSQLEQVLLNLAVNARDAMPDGGTLTFETSNIEIEASNPHGLKAGSYVMLQVSDTGSGIDPSVIKRIFEPFFTTKEIGKGTGLGLATVYGMVRQCGGHVDLESEVGRGTCFKILLPATADVTTAPRPRPSTVPPPPSTTANILLVEDDDSVRKVTSRILRARGYNVLEARSPSEALAIYESSTVIHLLLTDLTLPETSGLALARRLAPSSPEMRVLFMSGYSDHNVPEGGEFAEVAYLEKPFSPYSLAERVSELLGARSLP
ncbi:MAG TPA: response regulator [Polyangiaceae bacterium]